MAPTRRGGRPRNDWTSSRRRKLARLRCFTYLTVKDMQEILQEDGFNPGLRDYKTQLSGLFPSDYGQEVLRYRPSNWHHAQSRFQNFKACRGSRIEKSRLDLRSQHRKRDSKSQSDNHSDAGERACSSCPWRLPLSNYSTPPMGLDPYVSPQALLLADGNNTQEIAWSPSYGFSDNFHQSSETDTASTELSENGSMHSPLSVNTESSRDDLSEKYPVMIVEPGFASTKPPPSKPLPAIPNLKHEARDSVQLAKHKLSSPTPGIRSWERRIAGSAGMQVVEHINSVLRYSSTNSWRSSIISIASSLKSRGSSLRNRESSLQDSRSSTDFGFSTKEQTSWNELVDESQLAPSAQSRPSYQEISLESRPCCQDSAECDKCGFGLAHGLGKRCDAILHDRTGSIVLPPCVAITDRFGNTILHCAAASNCLTTLALEQIITSGAKPNARNSSGETFMHVLNVPALGDVINYIELLKFLEGHDFLFESRDHHGRTIAHKFFQATKLWDINPRNLEEIFVRLRVDFNAVDNLGYDFGLKEIISFWESAGPGSTAIDCIRLSVILLRHRDPRYRDVDYKAMLLSLGKRTKSWVGMVKIKSWANWVDIHGDTPLTAVLKHWSEDKEEGRALVRIVRELVQQGCEVQARDRRGYTALAIAAYRGLRPAVVTLLELGARANTRSYNGTSVLNYANGGLRWAAKGGNSRLYGMILSCVTLLNDFGGLTAPTAYDEFSQEAPVRRLLRRPSL